MQGAAIMSAAPYSFRNEANMNAAIEKSPQLQTIHSKDDLLDETLQKLNVMKQQQSAESISGINNIHLIRNPG